MKKIIFHSVLVLVSISFLALTFSENNAADKKKHKYIGASKCGMCHKKDDAGAQLSKWEASAHAKAFKTLQTEKADKIAKEKGFKTPAAKTDECLACHTTGHGEAADMFDKKFDAAEGVQCEVCHGAGDDYKSAKVMKDRKESIANGMIHNATPKEIKAACEKCHNEKSPTFKAFDFDKNWAAIQHPKPAKPVK
ncbi:MAG: cytochrome c family protein [Bacteroidetes bacterium]|nr:cytochrome c family protein [Bacteroidota bacterium]